MKRILIAHQSTIPHYRVSFYNALERLRPPSWNFEVVVDPSEYNPSLFFGDNIDKSHINFPIHEVDTYHIIFRNKKLSYQSFWWEARNYNLLIVENAVNNITYPLCHLHRFHGTKIIYWGHGKDRAMKNLTPIKALSEKVKLTLVRNSDGFFAYTQGVEDYLNSKGISRDKIFVLDNTIDVIEQRKAFEAINPLRNALRKVLRVQDKNVLIFIGRFTHNKRIDYLLELLEIITKHNSQFHLIIIGGGFESFEQEFSRFQELTFTGPIMETEELAKYLITSDLYVFPGSVGLGPLLAFCYDLPVITLESAHHGPEFEYLDSQNSFILPCDTTPEEFAHVIIDLFANPEILEHKREKCWPSIKHLTIDNMAHNFINGINTVLGL